MKLYQHADKVLIRLLQLLLIAIVAAVCWQVASRYLLADPSSVTEEFARFSLIWLTLLSTAYAYRHHAHLGLDLIYQKATGKQKQLIFTLIHSATALFAITILIIGGSRLVMMTYSLGQTSAVMGIDIALVYLAIPLSGLFILLFSVENLTQQNRLHETD